MFFRIETEICDRCAVDPFNLRAAASWTCSNLNFPRFLISWTQKVPCSRNEGFHCAIVFYSRTFIFMLSSNKVWEKRLISGLSQAGTAWLRKSSRYDSRDFLGGTGWAVQLFAAPLKN